MIKSIDSSGIERRNSRQSTFLRFKGLGVVIMMLLEVTG